MALLFIAIYVICASESRFTPRLRRAVMNSTTQPSPAPSYDIDGVSASVCRRRTSRDTFPFLFFSLLLFFSFARYVVCQTPSPREIRHAFRRSSTDIDIIYYDHRDTLENGFCASALHQPCPSVTFHAQPFASPAEEEKWQPQHGNVGNGKMAGV